MKLSPLIVACLAATWLVWGSTYLAIKFALVSFPPFWQMGTRFLVAGSALLAWMMWRKAALPTRRQWGHAGIVGALMLGGGMGMTAYAEQFVSSGIIVAFLAVTPAVMTLFNLLFGVRPTRLEVIGIAVGLVGVMLLIRGESFVASPEGLFAIAFASVSWSAGSVLSLRKLPLAPGAVGFASEMLCGGLLLMAISFLVGERPALPPQPLALGAWVYLVVFGSLIAFNAYMVLLRESSAVLATSYTFVNPLIALLLGVALGGEVVSGFEWLSASVIIVGVILLVVGRRA